MTISKATPLYRKNTVQHGADADKDPHPRAGMEYNSDDLKTKNICFENGVWDNASPLSVDEFGYIYFDGAPVFLPGETTIFNPNTGAITLTSAVTFLETQGVQNYTHLISTVPTAAELAPDNILSVATSGRGILLSHNKLLKAGTTIYYYFLIASNQTLESIYSRLREFNPVTNGRSANVRMTTLNQVRAGIE